MNTRDRLEIEFTLLGVKGHLTKIDWVEGGLFMHQFFKATRPFKERGYKAGSHITVEVRFDDNHKNGHMMFAVTGSVWEPERGSTTGGAIHGEVAKVFPELAHLNKWHLVSADGPMHHLANTTYHASDRDHNGLLKGEKRQIINGKTGLPSWKLAYVDESGDEVEKPQQYLDQKGCPTTTVKLAYIPWTRTGEGKERDLQAARNCAVWPEATDEQLMLPKEELTELLEARLPALLEAFKADMYACGFEWRTK